MNRAIRRRQERQTRLAGPQGGTHRDARTDPHAPTIAQAMRLQQTGRLDEARGLYDSVLKSAPEHPEANHFIGLLLHQGGETDNGLHFLIRSIGLDPDNADFYSNLGTVLKDAQRHEDAVKSYRKAVALRPGFAVAWNNLGVALKAMGRFDEAIESYRTALRLQPGYVGARLNLAGAEKEAGRLDDAIADYSSALSYRPNDAEAHYQQGASLMEIGRIDEAVASFRRTVALKPRHAEAYLMLASLKRPHEADAEMEAMERLYNRKDASESERMLAAFALAKSYEDIGRFDEAFDYLVAGNRARRDTFDYSPDATMRDFAHIREVFQPVLFERFATAGCADRTPVFIVGMPRSGTTLVEQILAAHPAVHGPGELSTLQNVAAAAFGGPGGSALAANLLDFSPEAFAQAGNDYVAQLRKHSATALRITDKMPGNFMLVGLIRLILPNATVLHCVRDAPATCLSIFKTYFRSQGHLYGYDLKELAEYYNLYAGLMEHWRTVLPGFVTDVRYEDLVADQENQSRAIVAAAGLDWDDRCLAFHQARRPVKTASAAQVRQPMYDRSLDLWRRYESGLKPLLDRLHDC